MILYLFLYLFTTLIILLTKKKFFVKLSFFSLFLFCGLRGPIAIDDLGYINIYNLLLNGSPYNIEVSFFAIAKIAQFFHFDYKFIFLTYSAVSFYFLYKTVIIMYDKNYDIAIFLAAFLGLVFFTSMTLMRQFTASIIVFYSFMHYAKYKNLFISLISIFLAAFFHYSTIISLIIFIIYCSKISKSKIFCFFLLIFSVVLGNTALFNNFIVDIVGLIFPKYNIYIEKDIEGSFSSTGGTYHIILLILLVFILIYTSFYKPYKKSNFLGSILLNKRASNPIFMECILLSIIFFTKNLGVLSRISFTFYIYFSNIPYSLSHVFDDKHSQNIISIISYVVMFILFIISLISYKNIGYFVPYSY